MGSCPDLSLQWLFQPHWGTPQRTGDSLPMSVSISQRPLPCAPQPSPGSTSRRAIPWATSSGAEPAQVRKGCLDLGTDLAAFGELSKLLSRNQSLFFFFNRFCLFI